MGDRIAHLSRAKKLISEEIGALTEHSSIYETAAWGMEDQPAFYNQVVSGFTKSGAAELMRTILIIETEMGRRRMQKWTPRIIDIDILFFENAIIEEAGLIVPHPMFHMRRFNLVPLVELMPEWIDPRSGKSMQTLLDELTDDLEVRKIA